MRKDLREEGEDLARLKGLSDGVFAIVLTLLVLNLDPPRIHGEPTDMKFLHGLLALQDVFIGYVVSFFVIGAYWIAHNRLFEHIQRYGKPLLWINLSLLFFISLLPFTTSLATEFPDITVAWVIYAGNVIMVGISSTALWARAMHRGYVDRGVTQETQLYIIFRSLVTPAVFLLSIPVAYVERSAAPFVPLVAIVVNVLLQRRYSLPSAKVDEEASVS